nr:MAG: hypothetical protein [Caudoviricetes sp.]
MSFKNVTRVYSGRPGCMCGCQGKYYSPTDKGFNRVLNTLLKQPDVNYQKNCAETHVGNRVYVAYFN